MIFEQYEIMSSFGSNCYIIGCSETKEVAVIDPGGEGEKIISLLESKGYQVKYIINTHGHLDHIGANKAIKDKFNCDILIHELDGAMLPDPSKNLSSFMCGQVASPPADRLLTEGEIIEIGSTLKLEVIHTPGHTPGGICLKAGKLLFTGDTLFGGSIGRSDFPGGSHATLIKSIKEKLLNLPEDTVVYPGHGPESTIGEEKETNPFLI